MVDATFLMSTWDIFLQITGGFVAILACTGSIVFIIVQVIQYDERVTGRQLDEIQPVPWPSMYAPEPEPDPAVPPVLVSSDGPTSAQDDEDQFNGDFADDWSARKPEPHPEIVLEIGNDLEPNL